MKILVVDDELVSRKKMQRIMDGLGECEAVEIVPLASPVSPITPVTSPLATSSFFR
ncbi:unnamed protein product [marine sediment metagenome]|uniref:Response regulatory domain-containing protein n=1 Tax=marine sediment metagenome TaxID=412755 RepID=X1FLN9_9ZZZZ